jgi:tight adherence protein C
MSGFAVNVITVWVFLAGAAVLFGLLMALQAVQHRTRNLVEFESRSRRSKAGAFRRALAGLVPQSDREIESIEQDLMRAGYYAGDALVDYLASRNTLIAMVLIGSGVLALLADPTTSAPMWILAGGAVVAALGHGIPRFILAAQARQRVGRIQRGLPDALDVIRMCLTGGISLRDSLIRITSEVESFHPDIAVEFRVIQRHSDAGTLAAALKSFARRLKTPDITALTAVVSQTERTGTSVVHAISEYADGIRRMLRQRAEEQASKTSISLLFPVVFCLAPPVFIILIGPPALQLKKFVTDAHAPGGIFEQKTIRPPSLQSSPANDTP